MAPPPSLHIVIAGFNAGLTNAEPLEAQLRNAYLRTLNRLIREAAANLSRHAITAASIPDPMHHARTWHLPDRDEVLPEGDTRDRLLAATQPTRVKIVTRMMGGALAAASVSFDVKNPLAQHLLANLGRRITEITQLTRTEIMRSLVESHDAGLSIPHAARAMVRDVGATNKTRATLIARTEFIGAQNGASLAAVQISGAAQTKTWLAVSDERTRQDHADADGQTVALADPFDVGGFPMAHPGDQSAPAEEVCNCRCTLTYGDA